MNDLTGTAAVHAAVAALAAGRMVVVVDDADRENEGDLIVPAARVTEEQVAFLVRHTTGILCAPMTAERADRLQLPVMVKDNTDAHGTAFTITVDHVATGTGVSAADRCTTLRAMADPTLRPEQLRRPGHVFPLRARDGGVLVRAGHTEAAIDLMRLSGNEPVAVIGEIVADDGSMAGGQRLLDFAAKHDLPVLAIADLVRHRRATERLVEHVATSAMPTVFGEFRAEVYRCALDGTEHLALVLGDVAAAGRSDAGALVRVHSECLTGDIIGSLRCDCGSQLEQALRAIADEGCGAVVYLRGHEGAASGSATRSAPMPSRNRGSTPSRPTPSKGSPSTPAATGSGRRSSASSGSDDSD